MFFENPVPLNIRLRITTQHRSGPVDKWPVFLQTASANPIRGPM